MIICPLYIRFPDDLEPLAAFARSPEEAQELNLQLQKLHEGCVGWWEEFEVDIPDNSNQILYAAMTGNAKGTKPEDFVAPRLVNGKFPDWLQDEDMDPGCSKILLSLDEAEEYVAESNRKSPPAVIDLRVVPFRPGWKRDYFFPDGQPWPPTT